MKRAGNLFERIIERENLRLAYAKALRGKRDRPDARRFGLRLDDNLGRLRKELLTSTASVGRFHQFVIHDPKQRIITAPCFEERVLHHAVMNVCDPVFERWLIDDTYACRTGRGRVAALQRAQRFSRTHSFFLKLDVRKYFDSIPHENLNRRLERIFKDHQLLNLFRHIVTAFRGEIGWGLPIGSLTSQHFANFYLGWFDRFVKERLRITGYVRYMDDMLLWADSSSTLQNRLDQCVTFLTDELELQFKGNPYINCVAHGADFLGCRIFSTHMTLNQRSRRRYRRKLRDLETRYLTGEIDELELQQRSTALTAFTQTSGVSSWQFRCKMLQGSLVGGHMARTG